MQKKRANHEITTSTVSFDFIIFLVQFNFELMCWGIFHNDAVFGHHLFELFVRNVQWQAADVNVRIFIVVNLKPACFLFLFIIWLCLFGCFLGINRRWFNLFDVGLFNSGGVFRFPLVFALIPFELDARQIVDVLVNGYVRVLPLIFGKIPFKKTAIEQVECVFFQFSVRLGWIRSSVGVGVGWTYSAVSLLIFDKLCIR